MIRRVIRMLIFLAAVAHEMPMHAQSPPAHRFQAKNYTVKGLIAAAYNLNPRAITGGPAWIESDRYEIMAATPGEARPTFDDQMAMLRQLLGDRFSLTFHREKKEF